MATMVLLIVFSYKYCNNGSSFSADSTNLVVIPMLPIDLDAILQYIQ